MKSLLDKINAKLNAQGGFFKAVSVLVGGTAFAQLIGFICLPILTRLYTPEDYSVLGVYVAIVSILSVVSCLRFEIAIPISKHNEEAKALLLLAIISNIIFTVLISLVIFITVIFNIKIKILEDLSFFIWFIPLNILLYGLYISTQYWCSRKKMFKDIAVTRVRQAIFSNGGSIGVGVVSGSFFGLILGNLINSASGLLKLGFYTYKDTKGIKSDRLKDTFIKYKDFPKYSTFEALANTSSIYLPLIIISFFILGPEVGYLMLAMKVLGIPMGLIGSAIAQVYHSNAPEYYEKNELYSYSLSIVKKIFKLILIPFILLFLISPFIFEFLFGKEWKDLGSYIIWMIPWYFMQMLVSPISMSLHIIGEQKVALLLQILGFVIRIVGLLLVAFFYKDLAIIYYILSGFLFYFIYFFVVILRIR